MVDDEIIQRSVPGSDMEDVATRKDTPGFQFCVFPVRPVET